MKFTLGKYKPIIHEVHPNVFVFNLLTQSTCNQLLDHVALRPSEAPNSMNKYGLDLHGMGLGSWLRQLMKSFATPIAKDYYPECGELKDPYGFIVKYEVGKQKSLAAHIDEPSAVTLNVCLGQKFEGGDLLFLGPRHERCEIKHHVGQAIVHRGHHLHQAKAITSGQRTNLILWCSARKKR